MRRTEMMIEKAFVELLHERDFQAITVQDIAERAMVNRATFYDHFADKYVLFERTILTMMRQSFESRLPADLSYSPESMPLLIATVCEFVAQVDERCRHGAVQGLPPFDEKVVEMVSELLHKWLRDSQIEQPADSRKLVANVASWAIYGAASQWRAQPHRESITAYVAQVVPLITSLIEQGVLTPLRPEFRKPIRPERA
ncbi:MAG: TetR/AcrR family transcriptional regulator [Anaerolineae bacterium]